MLTFNVILEYQGLLFWGFVLGFFLQSDWPTQHQETHTMLNAKKGDGLSFRHYSMVVFGFGCLWSMNLLRRLWQGTESRLDEYFSPPCPPSPLLLWLFCIKPTHDMHKKRVGTSLGGLQQERRTQGEFAPYSGQPGIVIHWQSLERFHQARCQPWLLECFARITKSLGGSYSLKFTMRNMMELFPTTTKKRWILRPGCRQ